MSSRPPPKRPTLALDVNVVQDNMPQEVVPRVFIGSIHASFNQDALLSLKITHIINTSRLPATFPKLFTYLSVDLRDKEDANILSCIPASNIFIEAGIEAGGVLVHCFGGRSRSAAFVAAYLMSSRSWGFDQAMSVICAVRPVASVNRGFERQLRAYGQTEYDVYAAQQVLLRNRIRALHEVRGSWRSPSTQSFRKHGSSGKLSSSSRNVDGSEVSQNRRTDSSSSSSRNEYEAKGSHGVGLGCDSFTSNGMDVGEFVTAAAPTSSSSLEGSKGQKRYRYRPPPGGGSDVSLLHTQRDYVYDRDDDEDDEEEEDVEDGYEDRDTSCTHAAFAGHGPGGGGNSDVYSTSESTLVVNPSLTPRSSHHHQHHSNSNSNIGGMNGSGVPSVGPMTTATPAPSPSSLSFRSQAKATAPSPSSSSASSSSSTAWGSMPAPCTVTAAAYVDPKSPRCRLSRPGSNTVRVIPPLRGLERGFCCSWCGGGLFCLANVLRVSFTSPPTDRSSSDNNSSSCLVAPVGEPKDGFRMPSSSSAAAAPAPFRPPLMTCRAVKPSGGGAKAFDFDIAFDGSGGNNGSAAVGAGMDRFPGSTTTSDLFLAPEKTSSSSTFANIGGSNSTPRGLEGKGGFMRKNDDDDGDHGGDGFYASAKPAGGHEFKGLSSSSMSSGIAADTSPIINTNSEIIDVTSSMMDVDNGSTTNEHSHHSNHSNHSHHSTEATSSSSMDVDPPLDHRLDHKSFSSSSLALPPSSARAFDAKASYGPSSEKETDNGHSNGFASSLLLLPSMAARSSSASSYSDESPRIPMHQLEMLNQRQALLMQERQGRRPESAEKRRWLARMRLLASAPSIRPPSASAASSSSASTPGSVSTSSYYPSNSSSSLSSKSVGPDNLNNSHRSLTFAAAPGTVGVSSPPSARLLPPSQGAGAGVIDDSGGSGGSSVAPPISVAVGPRSRSSSWSFLSAGVEKLARDDDEAILWLIYGDDSCSDGMTNGDGLMDDKDGGNGSGSDHGAIHHHSSNNTNSSRYLYVEYLDWMDPDGAILGISNPHTAATSTTAANSGGYTTSRSSSSTTIGGGGYPINGYHSEKETPLSSPLASSSSSLSSRARNPGGVSFATMGNDDASMASNSPEVGGIGASSSSLQDMGEIKCRHCRRPIGSWTWTPTPRQRLYGRLEAPIFRIHKGVVHLADVPLDTTPLNTPRPGLDPAPTATDNHTNNHLSHGLGSPGVAMMSPSHHHHTAMMSADDKQHGGPGLGPQQQQHRWGPSLSSK